MKTRSLSRLVLGCVAVMSSGCYTVLVAPFSGSGLREESRSGTVIEKRDDGRDEARLGQFDGDERRAGGGYGYGYGYGYPAFGGGYDSQYGAYGAAPYGYGPYYGYGASPYSGGYGPYGYGYDPYYRSSTGVYIPPGYELVTTKELADLRATGGGLATIPSQTPAQVEATKKAEVKKQQEVWQRRVDPQDRPAPVATPRPVEVPAASGGGKESSSAPKPASASPDSASPKKVRR